MAGKYIEITKEKFEGRFLLLPNHINPTAGWTSGPDGRGCLFETYGDEFDFVKRFDPRRVWTVIDGEDGSLYVRSGFHVVNRVGYLLSGYPVPEGDRLVVCIPFEDNS